MTSRERVLAVLNRRHPDRIPFEISGTDCSSIHSLAYKKLRNTLGFADGPIQCACLTQLVADTEPAAKDALGVDVEMLLFGSQKTKIWPAPFGVDLIVPEKFLVEDLSDGSSVVRNAAGAITAKRTSSAYYFDPVGTPLAEIPSARALDAFDDLFERWDYSPVYDETLQQMSKRAKAQYDSTNRAVAAMWRFHYLQTGQFLRGYEQFFVDLMTDKNLCHAILQKLHAAYLKRADAFLAALKDSLDVVFVTDDLGTQESGLISPSLYKEMILPYWAEMITKIKKAGKKVVMHSCGAVSEFIPFFIEMGVDALNPVQVSAHGMNPKDLVRNFGRDIAFWGGGCDTQHALNAADPNTVREDVRRRMKEFGSKAFWVFTQVHNIQYDVPPQNVLAMKDEFWKMAG